MNSTAPQNTQKYSLGLLTTVAQLPPKYKIRYLARATLIDSPLDLTIKQIENPQNITISSSQIITVKKEIKTEYSQNQSFSDGKLIATGTTTTVNKPETTNGPMTPPPSPPKKRYRDENFNDDNQTQVAKKPLVQAETNNSNLNEIKIIKEVTPKKPIKNNIAPHTSKLHPNNTANKEKKTKAIRKLKFDEYQSSPVSGTIIRPFEEITENDDRESGDIDPQYNIVEVTDEAKAELALIKNVIGSYSCKLCRQEFEDAFGLARHRCSCIVLLEYRCPECDKRFNCPANLASHRRWHKPKEEVLRKQRESSENELQFSCDQCNKKFKRQAYLRKHSLTHTKTNPKKTKSNLNKSKQNTRKNNNQLNSNISKENFNVSSNLNSVQDDSQHSLPSSVASQNDSITIINYTKEMNYNKYDTKEINYNKYDSDMESTTSRSSSCSSPGRLQIVESLTEEENIAATALANLGRWNGTSVIQHGTTVAF